MKKLRWTLCFSAALLLMAPALSLAYSGRESRGAEWLQEHLRPGRSPEAYRRMLHDMGYAIRVNGDTPDYVEYDISKEDQAYRVKIGVDQDTGRAVEINVVPERGERAEARVEDGRGAEWLREHLRPGRSREAYRRMLSDMGYAITVNGDTPDYVEYDITKRDQAYRVKIGIDQDTGKAVQIDVVPERGERAEAAPRYRGR
jgi:uncharacterized protein YmfQ (DUF2313 family)